MKTTRPETNLSETNLSETNLSDTTHAEPARSLTHPDIKARYENFRRKQEQLAPQADLNGFEE